MGAGSQLLTDGQVGSNDPIQPTHTLPTRQRQDMGAVGTDTVQQTTTQSNNQLHTDSANIEQDRQFLQNTLGDVANQIELVSRADLQGHKQSAEGFFENGKAHLVTDNIKGDDVFSREERLAWVAWHELGHNGVNVRFSANHKNLMEFARTNPVVNTLRRKIQQRYADMNIHINDDVATEEAIVELYAASQTTDWAKLEQDYNLRIHHSWKTGENSVRTFIENVANKLRKIVGAVLKKDLSKATTADILSLLKQLNQDPHTENVSPETEQDTRYSLNESADSDFAKAVDEISEGAVPSRGFVNMGTTPDVLKMLGLPDTKINIREMTIQKVMGEQLGIDQGEHSHLHNLTAETLKKLPQQLNNPIAVFNSSTRSDSYVVLTELNEVDSRTGIDKPIIAALHINTKRNGAEIISIKSVYGRSRSQLRTAFDEDLIFVNKRKAQHFLTTERLQLPWDVTSDVELSSRNIKTESDLSQYQNNKEARFSQRENQDLSEQRYNQAKENGETELSYSQWKQVRSPAFKAWFGDWENDPGNASKVINPKTGEPLVVYHGTSANFNAFDPEKQKNYRNQYGGGFYFTSNPDVAKLFGDNVMPVFLNARIGLAEKRLARRKGQTVERDHLRPNDSRDIWVVYNPNQVKSAVGNNGEFSTENDDIRYSQRPTHRPKSESLEKLRQSKPIHISGKDIEPSSDLRQYKRNALNYGKTLRGSYVNKDTGQEIKLGRAAIQEVLRHDYKDPDHLQSIAAIPQIIEEAIYVDTLPNEDKAKHPDISSYDYYLAGLNIGGDDYTVRAVIANSTTGEKYYDHKLSEIEKGDLLEMTSRVSTAEISNQSPIDLDDKRLLQILQDKSAVENQNLSEQRYNQEKENGEHDYKDPEHLQSIAAIPQIIENAIYVDTLPNEDKEKHPNIQRYDYYVAGLNIGGDDYTVKAVVSTAKDGSRYYDHKLSEIEKGELLSRTSRITTPVDKSNSPFNDFDDKRLLQILQDESAGENEENIRYSQRSTNRQKFERFERLCQMKSIQISGKDIYSQAVIFVSICKNVLEYGKALRGIYINVDTGYEINLGHSRVEKRRSFGNDLSLI
ncbi:hypothetical protein ACLSZU_10290 [Avibacterium avium]|uniref:LPD3 domain-containing protein n=1 Tax=Avibacterium avium TaxID=751 RepID=UPI003BF8455A